MGEERRHEGFMFGGCRSYYAEVEKDLEMLTVAQDECHTYRRTTHKWG